MRFIALDVHRDFCDVAIKDGAGLRLAGRVKSSVSELELLAQSLAPETPYGFGLFWEPASKGSDTFVAGDRAYAAP